MEKNMETTIMGHIGLGFRRSGKANGNQLPSPKPYPRRNKRWRHRRSPLQGGSNLCRAFSGLLASLGNVNSQMHL